jgi:hypothetical protein
MMTLHYILSFCKEMYRRGIFVLFENQLMEVGWSWGMLLEVHCKKRFADFSSPGDGKKAKLYFTVPPYNMYNTCLVILIYEHKLLISIIGLL